MDFILREYLVDCFFNPSGESDELDVNLNLFKINERSEAQLRVKFNNRRYFDAKLRFTLLASMRSAVFTVIKVDNKLVIFPARVKLPCLKYESHYESKLFSSPNLAYFMKLFFLFAVLCVRGRFRRGLAEILIFS